MIDPVKILLVLAAFATIFYGFCEGQLSPGTCGQQPDSCSDTEVRSYDGSCNNLDHPTWGMSNTRYNRLLPPDYGNGKASPRLAESGDFLPPSRKVSSLVYPDKLVEDPIWTLSAMQYGQIIAHDMSMTSGNIQTKKEDSLCCSDDNKLSNVDDIPDKCYPIVVPKDDPDFSKFNIECFQFSRTGTDKDFGCNIADEPVQQLSQVTHYLDLGLVYGQNEENNKKVRFFKGGKLKFEERRGQVWLPTVENVTETCTVKSSEEPCYMAGDTRVNQNPQLTVLQTIFLREHNRVANVLAELNPHWNDEKIFQEARKICIAEHQNIAYYEWLPIFLGRKNLLRQEVIYETDDFVDDYNCSVNPSILNEHATAAFRFYHSTIAGSLDLVSTAKDTDEDLRLSDWFNRPAILEKGNTTFDELTRGLATQHQYAADEFHDKEITNYWDRPIDGKIGQDLQAISIQRGRDHGLPSYNDLREYCEFPRAKNFSDFSDFMSDENVEKLESLYAQPDDVDLTVGGSLEKLVPGTLAGPTFSCIITEQFYRTRVGDRFFFENSGETGFSLPQLLELRKSSVSKIMCENTNVGTIQSKGFEVISSSNPRVPCEDLPSVNLTLWKEENYNEI